MSLVEFLFGMTEDQVRAEVIKRAGDEIMARHPDTQYMDIDGVVEAVLDATVEAYADDTMRAYMTLTGWR
jgi:hypothetical protein